MFNRFASTVLIRAIASRPWEALQRKLWNNGDPAQVLTKKAFTIANIRSIMEGEDASARWISHTFKTVQRFAVVVAPDLSVILTPAEQELRRVFLSLPSEVQDCIKEMLAAVLRQIDPRFGYTESDLESKLDLLRGVAITQTSLEAAMLLGMALFMDNAASRPGAVDAEVLEVKPYWLA